MELLEYGLRYRLDGNRFQKYLAEICIKWLQWRADRLEKNLQRRQNCVYDGPSAKELREKIELLQKERRG